MAYCAECGTKNEDDARYCSECGANMKVSRDKDFERRAKEWGEQFGKRAEKWGEQFGKRGEEECFGFPYGSIIAALVIGAIVILVGVSWLAGINIGEYIWPFALITFGVLIVAGSLYSYSRKH